MVFADRKDAGRKLAALLDIYRGRSPLVLAIPKGGVEIGIEIAAALDGALHLLVSRKLPYPGNPEAGFGAVAEDGSFYLVPNARHWLTEGEVEHIKAEQIREIERRVRLFRGGEPLPEMMGRTAILTDDGLAVGSTMRAALMLCRKRDAGKIVVAVPVAGPEAARVFSELADELVVAEVPPFFQAVAQAYRHWSDVTDEEAIRLLKTWRESQPARPV